MFAFGAEEIFVKIMPGARVGGMNRRETDKESAQMRWERISLGANSVNTRANTAREGIKHGRRSCSLWRDKES
jgi:hypothetical protein